MDLRKNNKVIRVSFSGGLFGLIFGSHKGKLKKVIEAQNKDGWNYVDSLPDDPNLVLIVLRLLLLILTLGIWTFGIGYILIFEKPREAIQNNDHPDNNSGLSLRAQR